MTAAEGPAGTARVPAGPFVHRETVRTATGAVHVAWTSVAAGNLALHVVPPDEAEGLARVSAARRALERVMGVPEGATLYLDQVHSADVVWADGPGRGGAPAPVADAAVSRDGSRPLAVMVADCLPVVLVDETTGATAVAHAGRRGLLDGVLEATVDRLLSLRPEADRTGPGLRAWIGPGVCGRCYEVPAAMRADAAAASQPAWPPPITMTSQRNPSAGSMILDIEIMGRVHIPSATQREGVAMEIIHSFGLHLFHVKHRQPKTRESRTPQAVLTWPQKLLTGC